MSPPLLLLLLLLLLLAPSLLSRIPTIPGEGPTLLRPASSQLLPPLQRPAYGIRHLLAAARRAFAFAVPP